MAGLTIDPEAWQIQRLAVVPGHPLRAAVIEQRLRPLGYDGGHSILREYIHKVRPQSQSKRAFVRMEPEAGERFEVDWGHFGALNYEGEFLNHKRYGSWLVR